MLVAYIVAAVIYVFITAGLTAYVASEKGRDGVAWFFIALFCFGMALLAVVGLPVCERVQSEETDEERRRRIAGKRAGGRSAESEG